MSVVSYKYKVWLVQQQHLCTAGRTMSYLSYSLAFLWYCIFLSNAAEDSCTEGFMELSLLETKAADTSGTDVWSLAEGSDTKWGIASSFTKSTCTARLTGVLIGIDIRTETNKNEFPKVEIWYLSGQYANKYSPEKSFTINLSPDNFTTSGLYHYKLPTGISVNENDRLVVYQPASDTSVVRFYYRVTNKLYDWIVRFININNDSVKVFGFANLDVAWRYYRKILLEPILGMFHHNYIPTINNILYR